MKGFIEVPAKRGSMVDDVSISINAISAIKPVKENETVIYLIGGALTGVSVNLPYEEVKAIMREALDLD